MQKLEVVHRPQEQSLEQFRQGLDIAATVDQFGEILKELFLIRNPSCRFKPDYTDELNAFVKTCRNGRELEDCGQWFYFPWNKTLVHYLDEAEHLELRTARNRNLITGAEQHKYYDSCVGVAGLSVGSHAALTIAMTGGAKNIKLADPDEISVSNLNRLRYGATLVGEQKVLAAGRTIAEINPYANIYLYPEGVTGQNIGQFMAGGNGEPKIDILLEGVDNLAMKIQLREQAKAHHVPVLMATDNGDGIIVDVERYDLHPEQQLFNGALGDFSMASFQNFPPQELPKLATKVAGPEYIVPRMLSSLMEVGRTLYSWPQLGTAATFTGVVSAYLVRSIVNGKNIDSGKFDINLDIIFDGDILAAPDKYHNEQQTMLKQMGL